MPATQTATLPGDSPAKAKLDNKSLYEHLGLFVRFKRTETFDDDLKYLGESCRADISWNELEYVFPKDADRAIPVEDNRPFHRLERAFIEYLGERDQAPDGEQSDAEVRYIQREGTRQSRIEVYSDVMGFDDFSFRVKHIVNQWRMGQLLIPTVNEATHKEMVAAGVKQRSDGLFGYKKLCANERCNKKLQNACFAALSPQNAIERSKARSQKVCSWNCYFQHEGVGVSDVYDDINYDIEHAKEDDEDRLMWDIQQACEGYWDGEDFYLKHQVEDLMEINPELWDRLVDWLSDNADGEHYGEAGEVGCEV